MEVALILNYCLIGWCLQKTSEIVMHHITLTLDHFSGYCEPNLVDNDCRPSYKLNLIVSHFCYQTSLHFNILFDSPVTGWTGF